MKKITPKIIVSFLGGMAVLLLLGATIVPTFFSNGIKVDNGINLETGTFSGNLSGGTNLPGSGIQSGTLNSNRMDAATLALFGTGGGGGSNGFVTVTFSPKGIKNGLSTLANDGKQYGPDTPNTTTCGFQEAINAMAPGASNGPVGVGLSLSLAPGTYFYTNCIFYSNKFSTSFRIQGNTWKDTRLTYAGSAKGTNTFTISGDPTVPLVSFVELNDVCFQSVSNTTNVLLLITNAVDTIIQRCAFFGLPIQEQDIPQEYPGVVGLNAGSVNDAFCLIRDCTFLWLADGVVGSSDHLILYNVSFANIGQHGDGVDDGTLWPNTSVYAAGMPIVRMGGLDSQYTRCQFYSGAGALALINSGDFALSHNVQWFDYCVFEGCDFPFSSVQTNFAQFYFGHQADQLDLITGPNYNFKINTANYSPAGLTTAPGNFKTALYGNIAANGIDGLVQNTQLAAPLQSLATNNATSLTNLNASLISSGTVPTARLGSGAASSGTFLRGDQTWAAASLASQSPWAQTIDAAGFSLTNLGTGILSFGGAALYSVSGASGNLLAVNDGAGGNWNGRLRSSGFEAYGPISINQSVANGILMIGTNAYAASSMSDCMYLWVSNQTPYVIMTIGGNNISTNKLILTDGASLTNLNASLISSGTIANARLPDPMTNGTIFATALNATTINGNAAGMSNMPFAQLNFGGLVTGSFTSTVCGYLKFTNAGTIYSLVVSTNLP